MSSELRLTSRTTDSEITEAHQRAKNSLEPLFQNSFDAEVVEACKNAKIEVLCLPELILSRAQRVLGPMQPIKFDVNRMTSSAMHYTIENTSRVVFRIIAKDGSGLRKSFTPMGSNPSDIKQLKELLENNCESFAIDGPIDLNEYV